MAAQEKFAHWWILNAWRFDDFPLCKGVVESAFMAGRKSGLEESAGIIEAECARVLTVQTGLPGRSEESIDCNIRMTAVLLPDIANAIRQRIEETP